MYDVAAKIIDYDNFVKTIDKVHCEVHEGNHYTVANSTTVIATSTYFILAITPNTTVQMHMQFNLSAQAAAILTFNKTPTAASTGTVTYTINNNNQNSTNVATMIVRQVASSDVTSTGTILEGYAIGASATAPPTRIGGYAENRNEWILATNSKYLFYITSVSTNTLTWNLTWYEE